MTINRSVVMTMAGLLLVATASRADAADADTKIDANDAAGQVADAPAAGATRPDDKWVLELTPYIWAAGIKGRIAIPRVNQSVTVDRSFGDVLSNLDFGAMGTLDIRRKRLLFSTDLLILSSSAEAETIADLSFASGRVSSDLVVATALTGYRVVDQGRTSIDLLGGARYVSMDAGLRLVAVGRTVIANGSSSNFSAVVGGRAQLPLGERLAVKLQGDVGLFKPAVRYQLMGGLNYDIGRHWSAALSYRHMNVKRRTDRLDVDMDLSGPVLGVAYRF